MEILGERVDIDINILSRSIIIENFHKNLFSNSKCRELFSKYGYIKSVTRKKCFVIIEYATKDQCHEAISKANSMMFERQPLRVSLGSDYLSLPRPRENEKKLTTSAPPYEIAIIVTSRELVSYAEKIRSEINKIKSASSSSNRPPTSHMMVLLSVDHLPSCVEDITANGALLAVIVNDVNYMRSSCTVRVLFSKTPQEHRNMPLSDALILISKKFDEYNLSKVIQNKPTLIEVTDSRSLKKPISPPIDHSNEKGAPPAKISKSKDDSSKSNKDRSRSTSLSKSESYKKTEKDPKEISSSFSRSNSKHSSKSDHVGYAAPEASYDMDIDPRIVPPTKNQRAIMQMVLDNRLVSIGELDEIANFIDMRRCKLGAKSNFIDVSYSKEVDNSSKSDPSELKNNILKMLYEPNAPSVSTNINCSESMMSKEPIFMENTYPQYPNQMMGDSRKVHVTSSVKPTTNSYEPKVSPLKRLNPSMNNNQNMMRLNGVQNMDEISIIEGNNHLQSNITPINQTTANLSSLNNALNNPVVKKAVDNLINVQNNTQSPKNPRPSNLQSQKQVSLIPNHVNNLRQQGPSQNSHYDQAPGYGNEFYRHSAPIPRAVGAIPPPPGHGRYPPPMHHYNGPPSNPYHPSYYPPHHNRNY